MLKRDHISLKSEGTNRPQPDNYDFNLYLMDLSYFSGKLETYMRFQDLSFCRKEPSIDELQKIKKEAGTMQVPIVFDLKNGEWLRDTTYIIQHFEKRKYSPYPVIPSCPVESFLSLLLEDFADEWLWRPAMYYRWEPTFDSSQLSNRFTYEFAEMPLVPRIVVANLMKFRQWLFSVFGEGINTPEQHSVVKSQYLSVLDAMEEILQESPFLLGSHPSLVDFAFMGPFFRHFSSDPTPRKVMQQRGPAVYNWVATMWNCKWQNIDTSTELCKPDMENGPWLKLLPLVSEYLQYLSDNATAWTEGKTSFEFPFKSDQGKSVISTVQTVEYRVWCRLQLQQSFERLFKSEKGSKDQEKVEKLLRDTGCWDPLWKGGQVHCNPEQGVTPPTCLPIGEGGPLSDSPKWPLEPLLARYFKSKCSSLYVIALISAVVAVIIYNLV